ncbi:PLDc N-terminal domain-containing protein [Pontibacter harenae]|uniref:PLDc N-terminal domain-containing protein n=1 Tax=Pontibacter harenae TaxID=2894083 RepID=UPI001E5B0DFF|nr:PLDc N-terminal domain-containing protein [Pontibacter harenae]MCC9166431.1 PLDc N-terminal domain-containing protein [Pontibacter harenae]
MEFITPGVGSLFGGSGLLAVVAVYYTLVLVSLVHLIFKTNYNLKERLLWMLVLWLVPIIGAIVYWVMWNKRSA